MGGVGGGRGAVTQAGPWGSSQTRFNGQRWVQMGVVNGVVVKISGGGQLYQVLHLNRVLRHAPPEPSAPLQGCAIRIKLLFLSTFKLLLPLMVTLALTSPLCLPGCFFSWTCQAVAWSATTTSRAPFPAPIPLPFA